MTSNNNNNNNNNQRMLSKHLSYERAVYSSTANSLGVKNEPDNEALKNLIRLGENIYDKVYERFGPVFPSSTFRNTRVNQKVGGSRTSSHVYGMAIDLDGDAPSSKWASVDNNVLFDFIRQNLVFDQLIAEYEENGRPRWVHVSHKPSGNRGQILIATRNSQGKTVYLWYSEALYNKIYKRKSRSLEFLPEDFFEVPAQDYDTEVDERAEEMDTEFNANRLASLDIIKGYEEVKGITDQEITFSEIPPIVVNSGGLEITVTVRKMT